jgi:hypothetical protein
LRRAQRWMKQAELACGAMPKGGQDEEPQ